MSAEIAVLRCGAAYTVGLDPRFPLSHARSVVDDADAVVMLTDRVVDETIREIAGDRAIVTTDDAAGDRDALRRAAGPDDLAYVIYTSGTTGRPKGVEIVHRGIVNLVASNILEFGLGPGDRVAQGSSHAYDSSVEEAWLALAVGATVVVMDDDAARLGPDLVDWLRRERVHALCPPPTQLRATGCTRPDVELPELRLLYVGGEALTDDVVRRWAPGRRLVNGYGPTECTVTVVRGDVTVDDIDRCGGVSIGRPVPGHVALVLDDAGNEVPDGAPGELCIAGPGVARGYRGLPQLTSQRFPEHPRHGRMHRTGDRVRRGPEGRLHHLGRIDSMTKVRGYRVELAAIEARLRDCAGVLAAACRVQGEGGAARVAAHLVAERADEPPDFGTLAGKLRASLPEYMVPTRWALIDRLPTSVGGKVDRRALPAVEVPQSEMSRGVEPEYATALEQTIASAFAAVLGTTLRPGGDVFLDLGADSIAVAEAVSLLRADPEGALVTVRDVYEARTVAAIAARAAAAASTGSPPAVSPGANKPAAERVSTVRLALTSCIQLAALGAGLVVGATAAELVTFLLVPWLLGHVSIAVFLLALPLLWSALELLLAPVTLAIAVATKRLLIGRYVETRTPVWSSLFLRNWIVTRAVRAIPWGLVAGTELQCVALKALGARVGRRVHIDRGVDLLGGGWDLLELGDDTAIGRDAALRVADLDRGELVFAPVRVGERGTLRTRSAVQGGGAVGADGVVDPLSWVAPGSAVGDGERWDGVPAVRVGNADAVPVASSGAPLGPLAYAMLAIGLRTIVRWVAALPFLALAVWLAHAVDVDSERVVDWLRAPSLDGLGLLLGLLCVAGPFGVAWSALLCRGLGTTPVGTHGRWTPCYALTWTRTGLIEAIGTVLSGTLFWPAWLRFAGMRVGRGSEVSTILDALPERTEIGAASFLADGVYLGGPEVRAGTVTVGTTRLGDDTFVGNHVVFPTSFDGGGGFFTGVSVPVTQLEADRGRSWFGHPPFALPRPAPPDVDRRLTHDPTPLRRAVRLFWEALRFALPCVPLLLFVVWASWAVSASGAAGAVTFRLVTLPLVTAAVAALAVVWVCALKWLLIGRARPGSHPLWSSWCSRWDFLYVAWGAHARSVLSAFEGTVFLGWVLRAFGVRVGRRVVLGGGFAQVVDPDMLEIDDHATVSGHLQAHTFEGRVLRLGRVRIGKHATVGPGTVLLYGTDVGDGARVLPHGVVTKHDRLRPGGEYAGVPVAEVGRRTD